MTAAPGAPGARGRHVSAMFTRIARRYDLMNSLMTAGRHHAWRRLVARAVVGAPPGPILDLATGTADLALAIREADGTRLVVGADFSEGMLAQAGAKLRARGRERVPLVAADALCLPFADATFAGVTSAFLLRNLDHIESGLREMRRVTRPGGRILTLDITRPDIPGWSALFGIYFRRVVPAIGAAVAGDRQAYTYLPDSVDSFLTPRELARLMDTIGLHKVQYRRLALRTIAIHTATV